MSEVRGLRLGASAAVKEKRLAALLAGRAVDPALESVVRAAQVRGSLELAGLLGTAGEAEEAAALHRAIDAVDPGAPITVEALRTWQAALTGERGFRRQARERVEGFPPPAPVEFIASRLAIVEEWLGGESAGQLQAAQQGALVLARVIEILPFARANGRIGRLAASHVMVRAGARRPILTGADGARLEEALRAAFQLQTEPLARLLEEASERTLDVMIAALAARTP
jgi:hypothetical protein